MADTVKISQLAKDLEIKSKDLVAIFADLGMTKQTGGTLEKDEVSFVVTKIDEERCVAVGLISRIIKQNI